MDLEPDEATDVHQHWDPPVGDRLTELVFIGIDMDVDAIRGTLDACVLTGDEIAAGFDGWADHPDPLPPCDYDDDLGGDIGDLGSDPEDVAR